MFHAVNFNFISNLWVLVTKVQKNFIPSRLENEKARIVMDLGLVSSADYECGIFGLYFVQIF
jgi:hypothetical protein